MTSGIHIEHLLRLGSLDVVSNIKPVCTHEKGVKPARMEPDRHT